jgi:hypothetical protein
MREVANLSIFESDIKCIKCNANNWAFAQVVDNIPATFFKPARQSRGVVVICSECKRVADLTEFTQPKIEKERQKDGLLIVKTTNFFWKFDGLYSQTETITDIREQIPTLEKPELYVITVMLILEYSAFIDPQIDIDNNRIYQNILENYREYALMCDDLIYKIDRNEEHFKKVIKNYFFKCEKEYTREVSERIIINGLQVYKDRMEINQNVERLIFDLLDELSIFDIDKKNYMLDLSLKD